MSASVRVLYFFLALLTMVLLALGSVMMAQQKGWLATLFFILGFVLAGTGFATKRRFVRPETR